MQIARNKGEGNEKGRYDSHNKCINYNECSLYR